jgi:hypothetical protein
MKDGSGASSDAGAKGVEQIDDAPLAHGAISRDAIGIENQWADVSLEPGRRVRSRCGCINTLRGARIRWPGSDRSASVGVRRELGALDATTPLD